MTAKVFCAESDQTTRPRKEQILTENNEPKIIKLPEFGNDEKGFLSFAQNSFLPFPIKRVYWINRVPEGILRGAHAHKELEQILIAISGRVKIDLESPSGTKTTYLLESPRKGLYLRPGYWREITFFNSGLLLCLASEEYDEKDYIRAYDEYLTYYSNRKILKNGGDGNEQHS